MDMFSTADDILFATLGVVAKIQRPPHLSASVVVVVRDGIERLGEFQQVVGRARHVCARNSEWVFRRGDEVTLLDRTHVVEALVKDDGRVNEAVLHG